MPVLIEARHPYGNTSVRLETVEPGDNVSFPFVDIKSDELRRFVVTCWENNSRSQLFVAYLDPEVLSKIDGIVTIANRSLQEIKTLKPGEYFETQLKRDLDSRIMDIIFFHV